MTHPLTDDCYHDGYDDGDIDKVRELFDAGVEIGGRAPCSGSCSLEAAICGSHMPLVRFPIKRALTSTALDMATTRF